MRPPVILDSAYDDPEEIRTLVDQHSPYWPVQRYIASDAELEAVGGDSRSAAPVMPWFRGDWAYDEPLVSGIEPILENPRFAKAARQVFGGQIVRPQIVYVNLMAPLPFGGVGHIDVPAFRGIDRTRFPVWILHAMGRSRLFREWQLDIATAVSWFYGGSGGTFHYWADGTDRPPRAIEAPLDNCAVVGDNDFMFHRVDCIGRPGEALPKGLGLEALLRTDGAGGWQVATGDDVLVRYPREAIRVSVSWKALVFADEAAARVADEHSDDLDLEAVVERFCADLRQRGTEMEAPAEPLSDRDFIRALTTAYPLPPLVYPTESETLRHA